ncbi:MAG TPA: hypothetical protein VEC93_03685, partial [Anaerolineae bacterium]|nr:hypothetical protein [Anaerolineae bacterium]
AANAAETENEQAPAEDVVPPAPAQPEEPELQQAPGPAATATATPSPQLSATPLARLTLSVPVTPSEAATAAPPQREDAAPNTLGWLMGAGLAAVGLLVVITGLVIWLIRQNQKGGPR